MSGCGCKSARFEALTVEKKKRRKRKKAPNTGPRVLVTIGDKSFYARKKKGDPRKKAEMKRNNPKVYYRGLAASQVSQEMKREGKPVRITDQEYQRRVTQRAHQLLASRA